MKKIITFIALLLCCNTSIGQMTLAHFYPGTYISQQIGLVNLSRSGQKIMTLTMENGYPYSGDTIFFYNMDYSFWKMIPCPAISGYDGQFVFYREMGTSVGVSYPSETLFNLDTFLEAAVFYTALSSDTGKIYIINENGTLVDSILHVYAGAITNFQVNKDTAGNFMALVTTLNGAAVYSLPGSLPVESWFIPPSGIGMNKPSNDILTTPMPNPSRDQVKIAFTLPEGVSRGELQLFNTNGQHIRTWQIDNRFGYIMLDNSQLSSGVYYYNIVVNGEVSSTQKLVVVK